MWKECLAGICKDVYLGVGNDRKLSMKFER